MVVTNNVFALVGLVGIADDGFHDTILANNLVLGTPLLVEAIPFPVVIGASCTLFCPCGLRTLDIAILIHTIIV